MLYFHRLSRLLFFLLTVAFLCLICFTGDRKPETGDIVGTAYFGRNDSSIYFKDYDFSVRGYDLDGITYFFLPSFIHDLRLDYSESDLEFFTEDGMLLSKPASNCIETVHIRQPEDGANIADRSVDFLISENLYTMDVKLEDTDLRFISRKNYSPAAIKQISPSGFISSYTEQALIKGRGNTTWNHEKKPYEIRFPVNTPVAGLWSSDSWALLANHYDPTKIKHRLAFDIADALELEAVTDSEWIDLYVDGDYLGNYLVCHEPPDIPGGCLIEANATPKGRVEHYSFTIPSGTSMTLCYPDFPTQNDRDFITSVTDRLDNAIHYAMPDAQFSSFDRDSFADLFLVDEISLNADIDFSSHFYYIKPGQNRMYAGPPWDYDKAFGYSRAGMRDWTNSILKPDSERLDWQDILMTDKEYNDLVASKFSQHADALKQIAYDNIDTYYNRIRASVNMDRIRWAKHADDVMYDNPDNDVRYLKFFLSNRLAYLSGKYHSETSIAPADIFTKDVHLLTLNLPDGSTKEMPVEDGTLLKQEDLPPLTGSDIWCFDFHGKLESADGFIPVLEDSVLEVGTPVSQKPDKPLPKRK